MNEKVKTCGAYTLYKGGNVGGRGWYATGPCASGEIRCMASFWNEGDGLRWIEKMEKGDRFI